MRGLPSNPCKSFMAVNPQLYGQTVPKTAPANSPAAKAAKRLRQSANPLMNKLETEFYARIKDLYPNYPPARAQAKRYRLANGLYYTPDFTASLWPGDSETSKETAWEVKGPWFPEHNRAKVKSFAHEWPEIRVILVWKDFYGQWCEQTVLP